MKGSKNSQSKLKYSMGKYILFAFAIVLFYSCSSENALMPEGNESFDCDQLFSYTVEVTSSGDFEYYSSAITINAEGNGIVINSDNTVTYLSQYPINQQSTNEFFIESSNKLYVRIVLGEATSNLSLENAEIKVKIFRDVHLVREELFTILPDNVKDIVLFDHFPCG